MDEGVQRMGWDILDQCIKILVLLCQSKIEFIIAKIVNLKFIQILIYILDWYNLLYSIIGMRMR